MLGVYLPTVKEKALIHEATMMVVAAKKCTSFRTIQENIEVMKDCVDDNSQFCAQICEFLFL